MQQLADNWTPDLGVIIAGLIILKLTSPSRFYADPAISLAISLMIFASAIPLSKSIPVASYIPIIKFRRLRGTAKRSGRILLEAAPLHLDLTKIMEDLLAVSNCNLIRVTRLLI
jgi:solute carrier family 30 (zinc transporter), member 1